MRKRLFAALAFLCATLPQLWAQTILTTPQYYEVIDMSPNGNWVCGIYNDMNNTNHAFRWNLETNNIELLDANESQAHGIADDGTVCGVFLDNQALANGAPVEMAGYWKDGSWHHLEMPEGNIADGLSYGGISADGHYMSGTIFFSNGNCYSYIWHDGKIVRRLESPYSAITYGISPDGQSACGWAYFDRDGKQGNRTPAYWDKDGKLTYLCNYESYASCAKRFSPDGKKIVFWGGYTSLNTDDAPEIRAIYDIETEQISTILQPSEIGVDFFDISNNGTVVGGYENKGGGLIYNNGVFMDILDYLAEKGVSLDKMDIMLNNDKPVTIGVTCISGDDSRLILTYYDSEGQERSMAIMFDDNNACAPLHVTAEQMQGINTVCLTWQESVLADNPLGYNIYRGTTKVNDEPVKELKYYDKVGATGTYTYTIEAVYADVAVKSEEVSVSVSEQPISAPQTVSARQRGINSASIQWVEPLSNNINRTYIDMEKASIEAFGVVEDTEFEFAVRFDKDDLSNYAGCKVTKVQFYPMGTDVSDWQINLYTYDAEGALTLLKSQPITQNLSYSTMNTVTLDTPLDLPDDELIVAIHTFSTSGMVMGMDYGSATPLYSDLIRTANDADFYSMTQMTSLTSNPYRCQWLMNVVFTPSDADADADKIDHYNIYADDTKVGETTSLTYATDGLTDGEHTLGVSATYANGKTSEAASTSVTVTTRPKSIDNIYLTPVGETGFNAYWNAPTDDDDTFLTYASGEPAASSPKGTSSTNYGFMASVVYPQSMVSSYDGYRLYAFRFYPLSKAMFTFKLEKNDSPVCEFDVQNCAYGQWNTVYLPTPQTIDGTANYRLILDIYDGTADQAPLAIDTKPSYEYYSDALSTDNGKTWYPMSAYSSLSANWMLGWKMADPNGKSLDVEGYDVFVDGVKKSETTDTKFSYDFGASDSGNHDVRVDVRYPSMTESVEGTPFYFTIAGVLGIDDNTVEQLRLRLGDNFLRVEGEGVESVSAYNIGGVKAASAQGNTLNITNLAPGLYIVKAKAKAGELVRKIEISK